MSKFYGTLGYAISEEIKPGKVVYSPIERHCYGDMTRLTDQIQSGDKAIDDLNISAQFSVMADEFLYKNFAYIRYIEYMGVKWKVTSAVPQFPRVLLNVGGIYNDQVR